MLLALGPGRQCSLYPAPKHSAQIPRTEPIADRVHHFYSRLSLSNCLCAHSEADLSTGEVWKSLHQPDTMDGSVEELTGWQTRRARKRACTTRPPFFPGDVRPKPRKGRVWKGEEEKSMYCQKPHIKNLRKYELWRVKYN